MSLLRLSSRLLAFVSFCLYLSTLPSGLGQEPFQVKFRVVADKIVVPVTINGAGPFDFLLDTGDTDTIIDRKLAEELHLLPAGKMILMTTQGDAVTHLVDTDSLSMRGATVRGLKLVVVNHYANILPNVRGSLGEDFLQNFDLLIDNQRHLLQFESEPGPLADMLTGEHMPLSLNGFYEQKVTRNRLVVVGNIFGNKDMALQLDSGTPSILLFSKLNKPSLISEKRTVHFVGGIFGSSFVADAQTVMHLRLGGKTFSDLTVLVAAGNMPPMDIDGLLPTSLFRSIFISHSGKFVILDPSTKKPALAQAK
jgi:predicted aspartyl protease